MNDTTSFIGLAATWLYTCSFLCELAITLAYGLVLANKNWKCGEILNFLFMLVWFKFHLIENLFQSPSTSPFSWWVWFENGEVDKGIETNFLSKWNLNLTNIKRKFRVSPHFQFWWLELNHMQGYWLAHIENYTYITMQQPIL